MKPYADTSFLAGLYVLQAYSKKAANLMGQIKAPLPFSLLHELELSNAIRLCAFRGEIDTLQSSLALQSLEDDLSNNVFCRTSPSWPEVLKKACDLGGVHTERVGCRSLDIIHVASALVLGSTHFATFDKRQRLLAQKTGLILMT